MSMETVATAASKGITPDDMQGWMTRALLAEARLEMLREATHTIPKYIMHAMF